jgi:hypothetical protein
MNAREKWTMPSDARLIFLYQLRLKAAFAVTQRVPFYLLAVVTEQGFRRVAITHIRAGFDHIFSCPKWIGKLSIEHRFDSQLSKYARKLIKINFSFDAFNQFGRKGFEFIFVHNLSVSSVIAKPESNRFTP